MRTSDCILDSTLIGESSRVRSLIHCTLLCEKTPDCNALGYNGSTQLCRRAGALFAPSALNSQCVANEIVFKSGKIVRLAKSNQFDKLLNVCFPKVFSKMNFSSKLFLSQPTATKHNYKKPMSSNFWTKAKADLLFWALSTTKINQLFINIR